MPINIVASFDIECTSNTGSFPIANNEHDEIVQIGITLFNRKDNNYSRYLLSLRDISPLGDTIIHCFDSEKNLLLGFTKFIKDADPDAIIGYNICGFDFEYLHTRSINLGIESEFAKLSRSDDDASWVEVYSSQNALGCNVKKYYDMKGRKIIEGMKVVQKKYELDSYKLNSVLQYLSYDASSLTPKIFWLAEKLDVFS